MLLGDLIARFRDEAVASEMLLSLGDPTLTARVVALATEGDITAGELTVQSIGQFVNAASDEEWLTLIGQMLRTDNPGQIFLRRALSIALHVPQEDNCRMTIPAIDRSESLIRWRYLWWALTAIAVMIAVILAGNFWLLNFIHVFSSLSWTGIDLFMGFVLGPILRRVDLSVRREIARRLIPRMLFLMPTISIISGTTGWFLAVALGYTTLGWPAYGWVVASLVLVALMTIQGLGFLTPVNVFVCLESQKSEPDMKKIGVWMQRYFYAVALQGLMQVAIIIVMTRFRAGV